MYSTVTVLIKVNIVLQKKAKSIRGLNVVAVRFTTLHYNIGWKDEA